jgi:hypothetical protein
MEKPSEIRPCQCHSPFQDALYGKGNRVFNRRHAAGKPSQIIGYGCSVCQRGGRKPSISRCGKPDYEKIAMYLGVYYAKPY